MELADGQPVVLFRYMPRQYCRQMVHDGVVRLTKSSKYQDGTGMTEMQMDDENFKSLEFESSGVYEVVDKTGNVDIVPEIAKLAESREGAVYRISAKVNCPYWMFCLSTDLRLGLFESEDFRVRCSGHCLECGRAFSPNGEGGQCPVCGAARRSCALATRVVCRLRWTKVRQNDCGN